MGDGFRAADSLGSLASGAGAIVLSMQGSARDARCCLVSPRTRGRRRESQHGVASCRIIGEPALYHTQVFAKCAKLSIFKPAEEMVYIDLDEQSRTQGHFVEKAT